MRAYLSIVVVLKLLSGPDQHSVAYINAHVFETIFLNVARSAADPWYLQQTRKSLVKVRINVCFMVKVKTSTVFI